MASPYVAIPSTLPTSASPFIKKKRRCKIPLDSQSQTLLFSPEATSSASCPSTQPLTEYPIGVSPDDPPSELHPSCLEYEDDSGPDTQRILSSGSLMLTYDQERVLMDVLNGKNVFFTGGGGSGKTFLLQVIVDQLHQKFPNIEVAVTASTGIAATHIKGCTIHSFAGFGVGDVTNSESLLRIAVSREKKTEKKVNGEIKGVWKSTDVLIIDEVSMISAEIFDGLEFCAREIRKKGGQNPVMFGGIQVIACGDFLQLPPVHKSDNGGWCSYAFQAKCWDKLFHSQHNLRSILRQQDGEFVQVLNEIRVGVVTKQAEMLLAKCARPLPSIDGIIPTQLFTRNADVDRINAKCLTQLPSPPVQFQAFDRLIGRSSAPPKATVDRLIRLLDDTLIPKEIVLKVGCQVMLLRNLSSTLANGSRGVVVGFEEFSNFSEAQIAQNIRSNASTEFAAWSKTNLGVPIVKFMNGETQPIFPERVVVGGSSFAEDFEAVRYQIPLKLCWAVTVHKCQGMSLDFVKINLKNVFEVGQTYVAISRAKSLEGLQLEHFAPNKVIASEAALNFHQALEAKHGRVSSGPSVPPPNTAIAQLLRAKARQKNNQRCEKACRREFDQQQIEIGKEIESVTIQKLTEQRLAKSSQLSHGEMALRRDIQKHLEEDVELDFVKAVQSQQAGCPQKWETQPSSSHTNGEIPLSDRPNQPKLSQMLLTNAFKPKPKQFCFPQSQKTKEPDPPSTASSPKSKKNVGAIPAKNTQTTILNSSLSAKSDQYKGNEEPKKGTTENLKPPANVSDTNGHDLEAELARQRDQAIIARHQMNLVSAHNPRRFGLDFAEADDEGMRAVRSMLFGGNLAKPKDKPGFLSRGEVFASLAHLPQAPNVFGPHSKSPVPASKPATEVAFGQHKTVNLRTNAVAKSLKSVGECQLYGSDSSLLDKVEKRSVFTSKSQDSIIRTEVDSALFSVLCTAPSHS